MVSEFRKEFNGIAIHRFLLCAPTPQRNRDQVFILHSQLISVKNEDPYVFLHERPIFLVSPHSAWKLGKRAGKYMMAESAGEVGSFRHAARNGLAITVHLPKSARKESSVSD